MRTYVITVASGRLTRSLRIFLFKILVFCSDFSSYLCKEWKEERLVLKREGPPCERNSPEPLAGTWNRGRGITERKYSDTYTFDVRLQITWTRLVQRPFVRCFRARVHRGRKVYFTSLAIFVFHFYSLRFYVLLLQNLLCSRKIHLLHTQFLQRFNTTAQITTTGVLLKIWLNDIICRTISSL